MFTEFLWFHFSVKFNRNSHLTHRIYLKYRCVCFLQTHWKAMKFKKWMKNVFKCEMNSYYFSLPRFLFCHFFSFMLFLFSFYRVLPVKVLTFTSKKWDGHRDGLFNEFCQEKLAHLIYHTEENQMCMCSFLRPKDIDLISWVHEAAFVCPIYQEICRQRDDWVRKQQHQQTLNGLWDSYIGV